MKKLLITILVGSILRFIVNAQISMSPISMSENGKIYGSYFAKAIGMSGTGIASMEKNLINFLNPAAYSNIDSLLFIMNLGVFATIVKYSSVNNSGLSSNINMNHISVAFRVHKRIGFAAGIMPYNYIGYDLNSKVVAQGLLYKLDKNYKGTGGLNNFFVGFSFKIKNNFYAGINLNYINGNIKREEIVSEPQFLEMYYSATQSTFYNGFFINYGIMFNPDFFKNFCLGITYTPSIVLNGNVDYYLCMNDYDTLNSYYYNVKQKIPGKIGIGLTIMKTKINWSIDILKYNYDKTLKHYRFSTGYEYKIKSNNLYSSYLAFLGGFAYEQLPYKFYGEDIYNNNLSFGVGLPVNKNYMILSLELGKYGLVNSKLLKEKYFTLKMSLSLCEKWFERRKYY